MVILPEENIESAENSGSRKKKMSILIISLVIAVVLIASIFATWSILENKPLLNKASSSSNSATGMVSLYVLPPENDAISSNEGLLGSGEK